MGTLPPKPFPPLLSSTFTWPFETDLAKDFLRTHVRSEKHCLSLKLQPSIFRFSKSNRTEWCNSLYLFFFIIIWLQLYHIEFKYSQQSYKKLWRKIVKWSSSNEVDIIQILSQSILSYLFYSINFPCCVIFLIKFCDV